MLLNWPLFTTYINVAKMRTLEIQSKVVLSRRKTWFEVTKEFFFARFLEKTLYKYLIVHVIHYLIFKNAFENEKKLIVIEKNCQLKRSVHSKPADGSVNASMMLGNWNVVWKKN